MLGLGRVHIANASHMTYFLWRQRFTCEVIATCIETFFHNCCVHTEEILHLPHMFEVLEIADKGNTTYLFLFNNFVHLRLLCAVEVWKIHVNEETWNAALGPEIVRYHVDMPTNCTSHHPSSQNHDHSIIILLSSSSLTWLSRKKKEIEILSF